MIAHIGNRAAAPLAAACFSFISLAATMPTDPSRALLGRVESPPAAANSSTADVRFPTSATALLNGTGPASWSVTHSSERSPGDLSSVALLGRTSGR